MADLRCQKCSHFQATTHITIVVNGFVSELHVCSRCEAPETGKAPPCARCGLSFPEMQKRGRLGCADDYRIFESEITKALEGYHGSSQHKGKIPKEDDFF